MKELKERDFYDLLNLSHELHCRSVNFPHSKKMHMASVYAKNELRERFEEMTDALIETYNDEYIPRSLREKIKNTLKKSGVEL